jgi:hypothetical protein
MIGVPKRLSSDCRADWLDSCDMGTQVGDDGLAELYTIFSKLGSSYN